MKIEEVKKSIIGQRVKGIFTATEVTGVIDKISETEYSVEVHILLDKPVQWGDDYYTHYWSSARKSDGWGNLQHTELLEKIDTDWMKDYKPEDEHITSWPEYQMIAKKLALYDATPEHVQSARNIAVATYHELKKNATDSERWDLSTAMMSVTAVIDDFKYKMGMAI